MFFFILKMKKNKLWLFKGPVATNWRNTIKSSLIENLESWKEVKKGREFSSMLKFY